MTLESQIKRLLKFEEETDISTKLDSKTRKNLLGLKNKTIAIKYTRTAYEQVMEYLCKNLPEDDEGRDPLNLAVFHGMKEFTEDLLEHTISMDGTCEIDTGIYGIVGSCLNYAADDHEKYLPILRLLFEHGADPDETFEDDESDIPVIECLESDFPLEYIALFIEFNVDIDQALDDGGYNLLDSCIMIGDESRVHFLLENGAKTNSYAENGDRPLSIAIDYENGNIVKDLLSHGANPNLLLKDKNSIFMYAIEQEKPEMAKLCVENSTVNFSIRNKNNETARDIAVRKNDQASVALIDQRIARDQPSTTSPHYHLRSSKSHASHTLTRENVLHRVSNKLCHK